MEGRIITSPGIVSLEGLTLSLEVIYESEGKPITDRNSHLYVLEVGDTEFLPREDEKSTIVAVGISSCYALGGISEEGDLLLGHHYFDQNFSRHIKLRIEEKLAAYNNRRLTTTNFSFFTIHGPFHPQINSTNKRISHYDIYLSKDPLTLKVVIRNNLDYRSSKL